MIDLIIIYAALFICGAIVLSFTIVVGLALYFAHKEKVAGKLYKSKFILGKQISMNGLPKPTRPAPPMPKCKPSKKEPSCECGRPLSKYFEEE